MMKVKLHQPVKGGHHVGDMLEVGRQEGEWLIRYGYASAVTDEPKQQDSHDDTASSEPDDKPKRTRRRTTQSDENTE